MYYTSQKEKLVLDNQLQYNGLPDSERVEAVQFTPSPDPAELTAATVSVYIWSGGSPVTVYSGEGARRVCDCKSTSTVIS